MFPTLSSVQRLTANNKLFEEAAEEVALTGLSRSGSEASSAAPSFERPEPLENGDFWAGFQDDILPEKENDKKVRFLRHQVFTLYRKLFSAAIFINLIIFIWLLVRGTNALEVAGVTIANLFVSILHRQDYVINAYFWLFTRVPLSFPFWIRASAARVYHIGGLHSGCGVSSTIWFILYTGEATKEFAHHRGTIMAPTLVITYCISVLLVCIISFTHPNFRFEYHDNFEMTHRFMGWAAIALVWVLIVLLVNDHRAPNVPLSWTLIHDTYFWLIVIFTLSIVLPWMRLRKHKVRSEVLSNHCIRLYFDYTTPPPGTFVRISSAPLSEWHSFATISIPGKEGYSMIISRAGDWTSKTIENPPSEVWVRGIPTWGMMSVASLFRKVLFVATGSGIAPIAPWIFSIQVPFRLLWTSPNVRQTFGDNLVDAIFEASPDSVIYGLAPKTSHTTVK
ncbi:hypothetical protein Ac2012v2_005500 [Leucoagaricus gongylophorus]